MDHNAKTAIAIIVTLVLAVGAEILLISRSDGGKTEKPAERGKEKRKPKRYFFNRTEYPKSKRTYLRAI